MRLLSFTSLLLAGCMVSWLGPSTAVPMMVDPAFVQLMQDSNDVCAHRALLRPTIKWFMVPGDSFKTPERSDAIGWWNPNNTIFIAEPYTTDQRTLQHELLHAGLGHGGHPAIFTRCGLM